MSLVLTGLVKLAGHHQVNCWTIVTVESTQETQHADTWMSEHVCPVPEMLKDADPDTVARWRARKKESLRGGPTFSARLGAFQLGPTLSVVCEECGEVASDFVDYSDV